MGGGGKYSYTFLSLPLPLSSSPFPSSPSPSFLPPPQYWTGPYGSVTFNFNSSVKTRCGKFKSLLIEKVSSEVYRRHLLPKSSTNIKSCYSLRVNFESCSTISFSS